MSGNAYAYEAVVIGASAGGLAVFLTILPQLPEDFLPVILVQHMKADAQNLTPNILNSRCKMRVKEACDNELVEPGTIYVGPPGYHLLMEPEKVLSLSVEAKVNSVRPAIDLLFESAAVAYRNRLIGILLTGSNADGAAGLKVIKDKGGYAVVQDPKTADSSYMPEKGIELANPQRILSPAGIVEFLDEVYKGLGH